MAATDPRIAEEACGLIEVEYEELPGVFDPIAAMKEGLAPGPRGPRGGRRNRPTCSTCRGGSWRATAQARKDAAFVVEGTYSTQWVTHCCLGTSGCIALFDTANNLTMYSNTQIPSLAQKDFIEALSALGMKNRRVRVIQAAIGGGFGSKLDTYAYEYIAIFLALKTRRPVKIVFTREEEFMATSPRQKTVTKISGVHERGEAHSGRWRWSSTTAHTRPGARPRPRS